MKLPDGLHYTPYFIALHLTSLREKKALRVKDDRVQELEEQVRHNFLSWHTVFTKC